MGYQTKISILAVLADRDSNCPDSARILRISILAVLADRDDGLAVDIARIDNFNPRGPCGPRPLRPNGTSRR